jgi:hypothetical protein
LARQPSAPHRLGKAELAQGARASHALTMPITLLATLAACVSHA